MFLFISIYSTHQAKAAGCNISYFERSIPQDGVNVDYMKDISKKVLDRNINQSVSGMIHSKESELTSEQKKARQALYIVLEEYALLKGADISTGTELEDAYLYPELSESVRALASSGVGDLGYNITKYGTNASGVEQAIRHVKFEYICPKLNKDEVNQLISNAGARL
tara:strand:- start:1090 stop:1590 length:501 start_codon:yes stop_codon:yes gene_type:complete